VGVLKSLKRWFNRVEAIHVTEGSYRDFGKGAGGQAVQSALT
jgi:hypothetical protein